jgi:RecA/RadA recombinase
LLSTLTVTVTVLVAICSVGVADGSVVAVAVAVSSGTTTVCWEVVVGPAAGAGVAKRDGKSLQGVMTLAAPMIPTITRAIAAWAQDGRKSEKPE